MSQVMNNIAKNPAPKLLIYGTGKVGLAVVRLADKKGWPVVAAFNRAGDKVGQDIGQLAGLDKPLGVLVQDCEQASFGQLDADIAIVASTDRLATNLPAYKKLLDAGCNILCHGTESYFPLATNAEVAEELNAYATERGLTFTGGGIWDLSRIWSGIMAAGPCTELRSLYHQSITDGDAWGEALAQAVGIGFSEAEFNEKLVQQAGTAGGLYPSIPHHVLTALGYTVTETSERREPVLLDHAIYSNALGREVAAGESAGTRIVAEVKTEEGVTARADIEVRLFAPGEVEHMTWKVDGEPECSVRVERKDSAFMSVASLFNRIPDVINAPPGIQPLSSLGPLRHSAL
ncbi:hypothetical protein NCG89_14110 [Spongiibacter taiwanensis]|uniref:hypothetical protein n=1 Tax=Spongiibacter taiwanensis TaxID=1748242 RepID=UPI0020358C1F|nr:hypothetical protein [Spongiibacter taiwanensis]USA42665.1 hypothetical protein NCG89_14110 [Spongiibacter taiwanensis]